jgi:glycosyltransferase involved in cell wall biosynthesis
VQASTVAICNKVTNEKQLRIGILGTRGIPNRYGGFEQCAEYLAQGLVQKGHHVWVYNAHNHEYKEGEWNGVHIVHCFDPEYKIGTAGQFIYDLNCINDARKRKFDIVLQLGYTSSSIWWWRWPGKAKNIVNMDGLEWKRSKYSNAVRRFLKTAEALAARHGDMLIADSRGIQEYLNTVYGKSSVFIPYGADVFEHPDKHVVETMGLRPLGYHLVIARMEPENNIEMIIRGFLASKSDMPLVIVGKTANSFGSYLKEQYGSDPRIRFAGAIYDQTIINNLRYYSSFYFHGHSVGGTNPSLLEAMGCNALIAAHDNSFNKSILEDDAFYFSTPEDVRDLLNTFSGKFRFARLIEKNQEKIRSRYNWPSVVDAYEQAMFQALK